MNFFEAQVSVEVVTEGNSHELFFNITLECTAFSREAIEPCLASAGEPSEGPEFEIDRIYIVTGTMVHEFGSISESIFNAIVGPEIAKEMLSDAIQQAIDSGDF